MRTAVPVLGLVVLAGAITAAAFQPQPAAPAAGELAKPNWKPGDSWTVEASTVPPQVRSDVKPEPVRLRWRFRVARTEKLGGHDCFVVEADCLAGGRQPKATLWVDQQSLALRQFQTEVPAPGGFRTLTESYEFEGGQPAPVMGPLAALPIDLPVFLPGGTRGLNKFTYEAHSGYAGRKAVGEVGFAVEIEQQVSPARAEAVKGLVGADYQKSLPTRPVFEVHLKSAQREVRQVWQAGRPWPIYSNNGVTTARLLESPRDSGN